MVALIRLTVAGADTGPTFDLYSNVDGYTSAFETEVLKADLLAGFTSANVPNGTATIKVVSHLGVCTTPAYLSFTTTTTTTVPPTTTTTTTAYTGPYYYYDVITYQCVDGACNETTDYVRIANITNDLVIGHSYFAEVNGVWIVFFIVAFSEDQSSPGLITHFTGAGQERCSTYCIQ